MNSDEKNQTNLTFDSSESSEWTKGLHTMDIDNFVGYNKTNDEKRFVIFDFLNKTAYVADEDLIDNHDLDIKKIKEEFLGLTTLKQVAKDDAILDVEDNVETLQKGQGIYDSKMAKQLIDKDAADLELKRAIESIKDSMGKEPDDDFMLDEKPKNEKRKTNRP
jgi:hypothetical protein